MNQRHFVAFSLILLLPFLAFGNVKSLDKKPVRILMTTSYGNIKLILYDQTPIHRDNFIKLVKEHYFDSLLFHRVIQNFMIQGGDPDSKTAPAGTLLGEGGPSYTLPAEFDPTLFHKKGVIAAARNADLENPTRASSASQFYIVQGKVYTDSLLQIQAKRITRLMLFNQIINRPEHTKLLANYNRFLKNQMLDSTKYITDMVNKIVDAELPTVIPYNFTKAQIDAYTTIGGTPHLDNSYTIFGEVYDGLDIVDQIAAQPVDKNSRPYTDIRILKVSIIQ